MDISIFLAKLLGLYFLILGILGVFRKKHFKAMAKEATDSKITLAVSAEICLLFGLVIAIDHSIWEWNGRGLITLLGYLMILKSILRFAFPKQAKKLASSLVDKYYWLTLMIMLALGIYLTLCGFIH